MAAVAAALPRDCSSVARAISAIELVERAVISRILSSVCSARAVRPTPSKTRSLLIVICSAARSTARCTFWISVRISSVDTDVRSERSRISSATTANPLPRSPACAAMIAAFSARRFVWPAISSITRTISPISWERSASSPSATFASSTATSILRIPSTVPLTATRPSFAASFTYRASSADCLADLPISSVVAFISTIELAV